MATEASWFQRELIGLIGSAMDREHLSARELSEDAGIPFTTLARKLVGGGEFSFSELYAMAEVLRVAPSDLVPRMSPHAAA